MILWLLACHTVTRSGETMQVSVDEEQVSLDVLRHRCVDQRVPADCLFYGRQSKDPTSRKLGFDIACDVNLGDSCAALVRQHETEGDWYMAVGVAAKTCLAHGTLCEIPRQYKRDGRAIEPLDYWLEKLDAAGR